MIDALFKSQNYQVARQMMDATVLRQQALAANIANAETPGYKRVDLAPTFSAQLQAAIERGPGELQKLQAQLAEDSTAKSVRPDGNNVEIERELLAMNRNAVEFDYLSEVVSDNLKRLKLAISGRVS